MEMLRHPGGDHAISEPGEHESWRELATHAAEHDQLGAADPHPAESFAAYAARRLAALPALPGADLAWARAELGLAPP